MYLVPWVHGRWGNYGYIHANIKKIISQNDIGRENIPTVAGSILVDYSDLLFEG